MTVIEFSESERARLDAWDAQEAAPEGWEQRVETAARAMWEADGGDVRWAAVAHDSYLRARYRRLAAAALHADAESQPAAGEDGAAAAVKRLRDVADNLDYYASKTDGGTWADGATEAAERIRAALDGTAET